MLRRLIEQCSRSAPVGPIVEVMARPTPMRNSAAVEAIAAPPIHTGSMMRGPS